MASIDEIAATLRDVAAAGMKPKDLLTAVRERHPEASKKEVVRAAFYALIENQAQGQGQGQGQARDPMSKQADELHAFAIQARAADEEPPVKRSRLRKKKTPAPKPAAEAPVF